MTNNNNRYENEKNTADPPTRINASELARLAASNNTAEWEEEARGIRADRGGEEPRDWYSMVVCAGLYLAVSFLKIPMQLEFGL